MAISTRQVKNKRDSNGVLTGRPGTVYDVNIKYTAPNGEKKPRLWSGRVHGQPACSQRDRA